MVPPVVPVTSPLRRSPLPAEVLAEPVTNPPRRSPLPAVLHVVLARNSKL